MSGQTSDFKPPLKPSSEGLKKITERCFDILELRFVPFRLSVSGERWKGVGGCNVSYFSLNLYKI